MRLIIMTTASILFATAAMAATPTISSLMSGKTPASAPATNTSQPAAGTSQPAASNITCKLSSAEGAKSAQYCHYNCNGKDISIYTPNTDCPPSITKTN
jgi:hypothetical protein